MALTDLLNLKLCSLGFANTTDAVSAPGGAYTWLRAHDITVTPEAPVGNPQSTVSTRGSSPRNTTGRLWHRLAFKTIMDGQVGAYAFASDAPTLAGAWGLLKGMFLETLTTYHATGVSPSDGNTISLTNNPAIGALIAWANSSNVVGGMGFVQSKSGGGPYATNLFEDLPAQPGSNNKQVPTLTLTPVAGRQFQAFQIKGEPAAQDMTILGGLLLSASPSFDEADNLVIAWEFMCYGPRSDRGGLGGLQAIADYLTLEPFIGAGNGRVVLGSNVFAALDDGTADAEGSCDVRDISIKYTWMHRVVTIPSLTEGAKDVSAQGCTTEVSFSVPHVTDYEVSNVNLFERAFRQKSQVSFSLYMGDTPGRLFAFQIPRGQVTTIPGFPEVDGTIARAVTIVPVDYADDGASTDAGNKPSRLSIG